MFYSSFAFSFTTISYIKDCNYFKKFISTQYRQFLINYVFLRFYIINIVLVSRCHGYRWPVARASTTLRPALAHIALAELRPCQQHPATSPNTAIARPQGAVTHGMQYGDSSEKTKASCGGCMEKKDILQF